MSKKFRKKSVQVNTDGVIKVGDNVVYNTTNDCNYKGDELYIKAVVKAINKLNWACCNAYEYKLDFGGLEFWVNHNKVRKPRKGEDVSYYSYGKYKVGQRVYVIDYSHSEATIESVRIGYDGHMEYTYSVDNGNERYKRSVSENNIRARKNNVTNGRFKVGDMVAWENAWDRTRRKSIVSESYTFDDESDIFYKLNGDYNGIINDHPSWTLCKPPKIIISDMDPYGEEDWNEE